MILSGLIKGMLPDPALLLRYDAVARLIVKESAISFENYAAVLAEGNATASTLVIQDPGVLLYMPRYDMDAHSRGYSLRWCSLYHSL